MKCPKCERHAVRINDGGADPYLCYLCGWRGSPAEINGDGPTITLSTADGSLAPAWQPNDLARWTIEDVP